MVFPLIPYILLTLGLAASLWMFLTLKREIQNQARSHRKRIEEMAALLREAQEIAQNPEPVLSPVHPVRNGFNLNHRIQAVRMLRRGEDLSHIAAALGATQKEVELLIRVHQLSALASPAASFAATAGASTADSGPGEEPTEAAAQGN